jgi:hypothetical protein
MKYIVITALMLIYPLISFAGKCPESFKRKMTQDGVKLHVCKTVKGLILSDKQVAFVVRDFDTPYGELSGVTVSIHEDFSKTPFYVEPGFGKRLVKFKAYGKTVNHLVKDINNDGSLDFAIRTSISDHSAPLVIKTFNSDLDRFDTIKPHYLDPEIKVDSFLSHPSSNIIITRNSISCVTIKDISKPLTSKNKKREVFKLIGTKFTKK